MFKLFKLFGFVLLLVFMFIFSFGLVFSTGINLNSSSCGYSMSSNNNYILTEDLSCVDSNIFVFSSVSNINFDCQGYTISGNLSNNGFYFSYSVTSNFTLENCNFNNLSRAVYTSGGGINNIFINNINISNVSSDSMIFINGILNSSFTNINIENAGVNGIYVHHGLSKYNLIENISVKNSGQHGFLIYGNKTLIKNVEIINSTTDGIQFYSFINSVVDNVTIGGAVSGIDIGSGQSFNNFSNIVIFDVSVGFSHTNGVNNFNYENISIYNSTDSGIYFHSNSNYNNYVNNLFVDSGSYGLRIYGGDMTFNNIDISRTLEPIYSVSNPYNLLFLNSNLGNTSDFRGIFGSNVIFNNNVYDNFNDSVPFCFGSPVVCDDFPNGYYVRDVKALPSLSFFSLVSVFMGILVFLF